MTIVLLTDGRARWCSGSPEFSSQLTKQLLQHLERPTLGSWRVLLEAALSELPGKTGSKQCVVAGLPEYVSSFSSGLGSGKGDPLQKLLPMRNLVAHGGRLSDEMVTQLLKAHVKQFEALMVGMPFLSAEAGVLLIALPAQGSAVLWRGKSSGGEPFDRMRLPEAFRQAGSDRMLLVTPEGTLNLSPLHVYGEVFQVARDQLQSQGEQALHIYSRVAEPNGIEYTVLGSRAAHSRGSHTWEEQFAAIFPIEAWRTRFRTEEALEKYSFQRRMDDLLWKHTFIGRDAQAAAAAARIDAIDGGVLWLMGKPGMGKSAFMAKLVRDHFQKNAETGQPRTDRICIPYFFQTSDGERCRIHAFTEAGLLALTRATGIAIKPDADPEKRRAQFQARLAQIATEESQRGKRKIVILADGVDDVISVDKQFVDLVFGCRYVGVIWVCAGRDEKSLRERFSRDRCEWIFERYSQWPELRVEADTEEGLLPPLTADNVRGYFIEELGHRLSQFFGRDIKRGEIWTNEYVDEVIRRSDGLPLYLRLLVQDIRRDPGAFITGAEQRLPRGLEDYYDRIIDEMGDDLSATMPAIITLLALAYEPLPADTLTVLLHDHELVGQRDGRQLLEEALYHGSVMLRQAATDAGTLGYTLYHESFSQHVLISDRIRRSRSKALDRLCGLVIGWDGLNPGSPPYDYALRFGLRTLITAERWKDFGDVLLDMVEAKLAENLGYSLLGDFSALRSKADTITETGADDQILVERYTLIGQLLGNTLDVVQLDPSSVRAQLLLEAQEFAPKKAESVRKYLHLAKRDLPWMERIKTERRHAAVPYVAQTAQQSSYIHSVQFSADSRSLLFFDASGKTTRWEWQRGSLTAAAVPDIGIFRQATVLSPQAVIVVCQQTAWLMECQDIWQDDFSDAAWRCIHRAADGMRLVAVTACPEQGYAVLGETGQSAGRLLRFDTGSTACAFAWRSPHAAAGEGLINHITIADKGAFLSVCFADGYLAMNSGFLGIAHQGGVLESVHLADRNELATVGSDETFAIWSPRKGLVKRINLLRGAAETIDYSSQSQLFAIGHRRGSVTLLTREGDGYSRLEFSPGVYGWVLCVRFSPCHKYLAVGGRNGVLRIFEVTKLIERLKAENHDYHLPQGPLDQVSPFLDAGQRIIDRMKTENHEYHLPQGPVKQALYFQREKVSLFLDAGTHLYSTSKSADSKYLPQQCKTFCADERERAAVFLPSEIRFIDPQTGHYTQSHRIKPADQLAATVSPDGTALAVLEEERLVIYRLESSDTALRAYPKMPCTVSRILSMIFQTPSRACARLICKRTLKKICEVRLDRLREESGVSYSTQRDAVPLVFCCDNEAVALPLEPLFTARQDADSSIEIGEMDHHLLIISVATGKVRDLMSYSGICNALAEISSEGLLAVGLGNDQLHVLDTERKDYLGYVDISGDEAGVVFVSLTKGGRCRHDLMLPSEDYGVNALAYDATESLLLVGCRSGRVRVASIPEFKWQTSLVIPAPIVHLAFSDRRQFIVLDNGDTAGNWPVLHEMILRLPQVAEDGDR